MIIFDNIICALQKNGGIKNYFQELVTESAKNGNDGTLINYSEESILPASLQHNIKHDFRKIRLLERYRNCAVSNLTSAGHFISSYYRKPDCEIDMTVTVHDFIYEIFYGGLRLKLHSFQKYSAMKQAKKIICVSNTTRLDLLKFYPLLDPKKIHVVHNGVSDCFKCVDPEKERDTILIYVGSRADYKNFALAISVLASLKDFKMIVVGEPFTEKENRMIKKLHIEERIILKSNVTENELVQLYNEAMFCLYPSLYEGFGIPILEAARCGCIPIVGPTPALMEVGYDTAIVLDSFATKDWTRILMQYTKDNTIRNEKIESISIASSRYSWTKTANETIDVIKL